MNLHEVIFFTDKSDGQNNKVYLDGFEVKGIVKMGVEREMCLPPVLTLKIQCSSVNKCLFDTKTGDYEFEEENEHRTSNIEHSTSNGGKEENEK